MLDEQGRSGGHARGQRPQPVSYGSADAVAMYMQGAGMGLAKTAELNRYPGPMHVLELGSDHELSDEQRARTQALLAETKAEARRIGAEIVALELRLVHLRAHIRQKAVLSDEQISRYVALRGHDESEDAHHSHGEKH